MFCYGWQSMFKHFLHVGFLVLVAADISVAGYGNAACTPQADIQTTDKLPNSLANLQQAKDFDSLVQLTKPKFTWGARDMLWVVHDITGRVGFTMNRAYHLRIGHSPQACCLLNAKGYYLDLNEQAIYCSYTAFNDLHSIIVARDPRRGVVYQVRWKSAPEEGSGAMTVTRNIFLLCDGEHRWHFLGEGPAGSSACCGVDRYSADRVEARATWTDNTSTPLRFQLTFLTEYDWDIGGRDLGTPGIPSLTVHRTMVPLSKSASGLSPNPPPERSDAPDPFTNEGPDCIVAPRTESLHAFVDELAQSNCCASLLQGKVSDQEQAYQAAEVQLKHANPSLGSKVSAGSTIFLPPPIGRWIR